MGLFDYNSICYMDVDELFSSGQMETCILGSCTHLIYRVGLDKFVRRCRVTQRLGLGVWQVSKDGDLQYAPFYLFN